MPEAGGRHPSCQSCTNGLGGANGGRWDRLGSHRTPERISGRTYALGIGTDFPRTYRGGRDKSPTVLQRGIGIMPRRRQRGRTVVAERRECAVQGPGGGWWTGGVEQF